MIDLSVTAKALFVILLFGKEGSFAALTRVSRADYSASKGSVKQSSGWSAFFS